VGLGGHYGFPGNAIPFFGARLPAIATAAIVGVAANLLLSIGRRGAAAWRA
jgi:uracil permease